MLQWIKGHSASSSTTFGCCKWFYIAPRPSPSMGIMLGIGTGVSILGAGGVSIENATMKILGCSRLSSSWEAAINLGISRNALIYASGHFRVAQNLRDATQIKRETGRGIFPEILGAPTGQMEAVSLKYSERILIPRNG